MANLDQQAVYSNQAYQPTNTIVNQKTLDQKCPSCGATLAFDPVTGGLACNFCGTVVAIQTKAAAPNVGYTLNDLSSTAGRHLQMTDIKMIHCGTCGGQFTADRSSLSGMCPYCGSNSITETSNSVGILEPTGVVPFAMSKENAQAVFMQWIKQRRFAPADLAKNTVITDLTGVYVPYWVFNCNTHTHYKGKFGRKYGSGDDERTIYHNSERDCDLTIKDLTIIASSRLTNDGFWKSVSSFDFNYTRQYDKSLLAGYWAETYTVDGSTAWQTAMGNIYDLIKRRIKEIEFCDVIDKLEMNPQATNIYAKYILAPVWMTSFEYNGKAYRVLVNGQTGKVSGRWPSSFKRFFKTLGIVLACIVGTYVTLGILIYILQVFFNFTL